jgi:hypothetical protein
MQSWERIQDILVDVVVAWTVFTGERSKPLD